MGALCSRFKARGISLRPKYVALRTESPSQTGRNGSTENGGFSEPDAPWSEARDMYHTTEEPTSTSITDLEERERAMADSSFDRIASEILQIHKPIDMLRSAITNSLLLFRMALGLTQDATMISCFQVLKDINDSMSIELVNTSDGPHKLTVTHSVWSNLPDNIQAAIKHFNSLMSSCHKFIGSRELKLVDIQLKLEDIQLLPLTSKDKERELDKLKLIPAKIEEFTREIKTLFESVSEAGKLLEYSPTASQLWLS